MFAKVSWLCLLPWWDSGRSRPPRAEESGCECEQAMWGQTPSHLSPRLTLRGTLRCDGLTPKHPTTRRIPLPHFTYDEEYVKIETSVTRDWISARLALTCLLEPTRKPGEAMTCGCFHQEQVTRSNFAERTRRTGYCWAFYEIRPDRRSLAVTQQNKRKRKWRLVEGGSVLSKSALRWIVDIVVFIRRVGFRKLTVSWLSWFVFELNRVLLLPTCYLMYDCQAEGTK